MQHLAVSLDSRHSIQADMMNLNTVLISLGWFFGGVSSQDPNLKLSVVHSWKHLTYEYLSTAQATATEQSGAYDMTKNFPVDVELAPGTRNSISYLVAHSST